MVLPDAFTIGVFYLMKYPELTESMNSKKVSVKKHLVKRLNNFKNLDNLIEL